MNCWRKQNTEKLFAYRESRNHNYFSVTRQWLQTEKVTLSSDSLKKQLCTKTFGWERLNKSYLIN